MLDTISTTTGPADTADLLVRARQAHANAIAEHRQALDQAGRAAERHAGVKAQRQAILDRVAAGENLDETDLARSRTAQAEAEDVLSIHRAAAAGKLAKVHAAEIQMVQATVDDHTSRTDQAKQTAHAAALAVDAAIATARDRLIEFQKAFDALNTLHTESVHHNNSTLPATIAGNPALASRHPSLHPKMALVPTVRQNLIVVMARDVISGHDIERQQIVHSLATFAAGLGPHAGSAP